MEAAKDRIVEIQELLNSILDNEDADSEKVLEISRELDKAIVKFYRDELGL